MSSKSTQRIEAMRQKTATVPPLGAATISVVTHTCGHKDEVPDKLVAKESSRPCRACRQAKHKELMSIQTKAKAERITQLGKSDMVARSLGVGYAFHFNHLGVGEWLVHLVHIPDNTTVLTIRSTTMRGAMDQINGWLMANKKNVVAEPAER